MLVPRHDSTNLTFEIVSKYGPNLLVFEMTSESIQEHEKWWAAYSATPGAAAVFQKVSELVERRVGEEIWEVTEFR